MKFLFKKISYYLLGISLLQFATTSHATLSSQTIEAIHGNRPRLSLTIEKKMDDFELFGLSYDGKDFYENNLSDMPVPVSYPFVKHFTVAPIKKPDNTQFLDSDGDEFDSMTAKDKVTIVWYYTNPEGKLTEFKPNDNDTFCGLTDKGFSAPFKVKISADIILLTKYGIPDSNEYPNDEVITQPSKLYTILEDVGVCYAKPSLSPAEATNSGLFHWDTKRGFLIQSNVDASKNFPTTGFYGANFDLVMANGVKISDYNWSIAQGRELINLKENSTGNVVNIAFTTTSALDTKIAWQQVIGHEGYNVVIQGENKNTGYKIQYAFIVKNWFSGWDKNANGKPKATKGNAKEIAAGCTSLDGHYRISYAQEVSNAPFGEKAGSARYTREIGTLLGEWGDPDKDSYPNSWMAQSSQANSFKRIWVWDPELHKYCDLHNYNAKYHCLSENDDKNGVCTAIPTD